MKDKETLKCNRVVCTEELDRHPELLQYIKNQIDSDIGEEVMHRIRDNGEFIVRAKTKEEQFADIASVNIKETVEIKRLIWCKDCKYSSNESFGSLWCYRRDPFLVLPNDFCSKAERREE